MKQVLILVFCLAASSIAQAQHFNRYCNSVFPFCIEVPGNFNRAGSSLLGDGQFFKAKDGSTLDIYGSFNIANETLQQRLDREQAALASDTTIANFTQIPTLGQAETQGNSFTVSYQHQAFTNFIYRKLTNNTWINLELKYPTAKAKEYEAKAQRMIESLK